MPAARRPGNGNPGIVPPYLLDRIAESGDRPDVPQAAADAARRTREHDDTLRRQREDHATD